MRKERIVMSVAAALLSFAAYGQDVERGGELVNGVAGCGLCHTPHPDGPYPLEPVFGGGVRMPIPKSEVYGRNITPDPETGVGSWTDQQIARAIREGVRPDGSVIGPPMAFGMYRGIADADVYAMVAYLRTLPPVRNQVPPAQFGIPIPPSYGPPISQVVVAPPRNDLVKYGEYLAGPIGACMHCHTGSSGPSPTADDFKNKLGAGGRIIQSSKGPAVSRNLTPHETGLGKWSDSDIEKAIRKGVRPDGTELKPPMPYPLYENIGPEDMRAIIAYLRSLKPLPLGG